MQLSASSPSLPGSPFGGERGRQGEGHPKEKQVLQRERDGGGAGGKKGAIITLPTLEPKRLMTEMSKMQPQLDSNIGDRQVPGTRIRSVTS